MTGLSRRQALIAAAALPLAPALGAGPAFARAEMQGGSQPLFHRFKLGSFEVTALLAGTRTTDKPQETFGLNASPEDFAALAEANFLPADRTQNFFTPTLVNTGAELVLFDTGLSAEGTGAALAAAGIAPDQVDIVVLTHMHGDHIGGLMDGEAPVFANAELVASRAEADYWAANPGEAYDAKVKPLIGKARLFEEDGEILPGIRAEAAHGHTPGHTTYLLDSEGQKLLLTGDSFNHHVYSVQRPEWHVRFDVDKQAGAATRKRVLVRLANEMIPFVGYHMPFPALGYIAPNSAGSYRYVPASYQFG